MSGTLTLVPTPIDDESPLCEVAKEQLQKAVLDEDLIYVEEAKACRRRWLHFGLPKSAIENFILYNEHSREKLLNDSIAALKKGRNIFLMSDCGLPAFCDPGVELVDACHKNKIKITATPFANSISLAVALSGIQHNKFRFEGFLSNKKELRAKEIKRLANTNEVIVLMDTPYRLKKLVEEFSQVCPDRIAFLGMELNKSSEKLIKGSISYINSSINNEKKEFILILE